MTIHHSQIKKAEKAGYTLTEEADIGKVRAFWPKRAVAVYGNSTADAMAQMQACIAILTGHPDVSIKTDIGDSRLISVYDESNGMRMAGGPMPPVAALTALLNTKAPAEWIEEADSIIDNDRADELRDDEFAEGNPEEERQINANIERINGIAIDGAVAFAEGTPAGDCPYSSEAPEDEETEDSEYDSFIRWNDEWDAAADEATDEDEGKGGSVVSEKYRAKYAEAGHPTHCGDWLAETLNEICLNKAGVNLELFEAICGLNGVDTSKYKRSGVGWQGRIRMTGRNLMSKKVFLNGGKLIVPDSMGGFKQAPEEWMAQQRFKALPKADTVATITVRSQ